MEKLNDFNLSVVSPREGELFGTIERCLREDDDYIPSKVRRNPSLLIKFGDDMVELHHIRDNSDAQDVYSVNIPKKAVQDEESFPKKVRHYLNKLMPVKTTNESRLVEEILSFNSLCNNWDGYGAIPLEVKSAANAIKIIHFLNESDLQKIKDIYPNPHGTISIELENVDGESVSIEVGNSTFSYYVDYNDVDPQYFSQQIIGSRELSTLKEKILSL